MLRRVCLGPYYGLLPHRHTRSEGKIHMHPYPWHDHDHDHAIITPHTVYVVVNNESLPLKRHEFRSRLSTQRRPFEAMNPRKRTANTAVA